MRPRSFPPGFLWGTATGAHQVEGQNSNNQWWDWEQQPGRIWHGDRSGEACGWWRDPEPDFDRAAALGWRRPGRERHPSSEKTPPMPAACAHVFRC